MSRKRVKISVDNDGDFRIKKNNPFGDIEYLYLNSHDEWEWWLRGNYFHNIDAAKEHLAIGRRLFILDFVKMIRLEETRKLTKRL